MWREMAKGELQPTKGLIELLESAKSQSTLQLLFRFHFW
jgi:hypothetical protein